MGKALYMIYGVFTLGVLAMGYSLLSSTHKLEGDAFQCMRLSGVEQGKCIDNVGKQAATLGKVARAIAGE
jgi:hypothetical protein